MSASIKLTVYGNSTPLKGWRHEDTVHTWLYPNATSDMVDMLDALESGVSHDDGYDECDYFSLDDYDEFRDGLTPEWREVFPLCLTIGLAVTLKSESTGENSYLIPNPIWYMIDTIC